MTVFLFFFFFEEYNRWIPIFITLYQRLIYSQHDLITIDTDIDHLAEVEFVRFLQWKVGFCLHSP